MKNLRYSTVLGDRYRFYPLFPPSLMLPSHWYTFVWYYMVSYMGFNISFLDYSWPVLNHPLWSHDLFVYYLRDTIFYQLTFFLRWYINIQLAMCSIGTMRSWPNNIWPGDVLLVVWNVDHIEKYSSVRILFHRLSSST